jgi:hypothetical protein
MSEENPYGGAETPPPAYPTGGYTGLRSDRWKIWLGIGLSVPALIFTGFLTGVSGFVDGSGALSTVVGGGCVLAPIVMLFFAQTRKVALGLLIGYAVIVILLGGTCIVLLSSFN